MSCLRGRRSAYQQTRQSSVWGSSMRYMLQSKMPPQRIRQGLAVGNPSDEHNLAVLDRLSGKLVQFVKVSNTLQHKRSPVLEPDCTFAP